MTIPCCLCGTPIEPNSMNMCPSCLASEVNITQGIDLNTQLLQCPGCLRYQSRGKTTNSSNSSGIWLVCPWESMDLMALCLKNIHGLEKAKLMDANFLYTEPHSKRIKLKLVLQREMEHHALIQKTSIVTIVIKNMQCPDCMKTYRNHTWRALVQIRQKIDHKRTLFRLEQLILKHQAHQQSIGIQTVKEGMDFYFSTKGTAERFIRFIHSKVPMRSSSSQKLISENIKQNTANLQTVYCLELSPICKDDVVVLPRKIAQSCSGLPRVVVCARTTRLLHFIDPLTGQKGELTCEKYWKSPFVPLVTSTNMVEFMVLNVEVLTRGEKQSVADVEVARMSDFGVNDKTIIVRSHLGSLLDAGDVVKGYDLRSFNFGTAYIGPLLKEEEIPDVILIRKMYYSQEGSEGNDQKKKKKKKTILQLERNIEKMSKNEQLRQKEAFEAFAQDYLEEEEEEEDDDEEDEKIEEDEDVEEEVLVTESLATLTTQD